MPWSGVASGTALGVAGGIAGGIADVPRSARAAAAARFPAASHA
jgi:hypothetical protein